MHENFLALRRAQLNKSREFNLEKVNRINPWCFDLFVNVNINKPRYVSKCSFAFTKLRNKRALVLLFCVPWIFCPSLSWVSVMRALSAWMTAAGDRRQLSVSCLILPTLDKSNMCSYSYRVFHIDSPKVFAYCSKNMSTSVILSLLGAHQLWSI